MLALLTHFTIAAILTIVPNENVGGGRSKDYYTKSESLDPAVSLAVAELMQFDPHATPTKWKTSHPQDKVEPYRPKEGENRHTARTEGYCAVAHRDYDLAEKGSLRRWAYFVVPKAPVGMKLPTRNAAPNLVFSECRMGLLFLEIPEPEASQGEKTAKALREALALRLGPGEYDQKVWFQGAAGWSTTARWHRGERLFVSAYDRAQLGATALAPRTVAYAIVPTADPGGIAFFVGHKGPVTQAEWAASRTLEISRQGARYEAYQEQRRVLREAIQIAGLAEMTEEIDSVVESVSPYRSSLLRCSKGDRVRRVIKKLLHPAEKTAEAHSASLLAADLTLDLAAGCMDLSHKSSPPLLQHDGAKFEWDQLGAGWDYTRNWLWESFRKAPIAKVRQLAFEQLMAEGFPSHCCCGGGSEVYERVIQEGKAHLSELTDLDIKARVEFILGDAYRDQVSVGKQQTFDEYKGMRYLPESVARRQAITHYRAGLQLDQKSRTAAEAWRKGWALIAGLPALGERFVCFYD